MSNSNDDISEMIRNSAGKAAMPSNEEIEKAVREMDLSNEVEESESFWVKRYLEFPAFVLDVVRDDSDAYIASLREAILAITRGEYGCLDYKGYKIYYNDTPYVWSISLEDGHKEYCYHLDFRCWALKMECYEEYHSEDERKAFIDPESGLFEKTVALLDKEIELLDEGKWIKKRKKLDVYDFKDYSPEGLSFEEIKWDDWIKKASLTLTCLLEDAIGRTKGLVYTEDNFDVFADVIRRMVFFADYGKRDRLGLDGLIQFEWKPKTKRDQYIWRCMDEYCLDYLPDRLIDNCAMYYLIEDLQGWEALAYVMPISAIWEMSHDYEPDSVKDEMLKVFDLMPNVGYRERLEKLIEEDRMKTGKGEETTDDQENI